MNWIAKQAARTQTPTSAPRSLVTGGAGFLGSHLCDRLLAEGHEVICVDNLLTGSMENVRHLLEGPRFTFIRHDISEPLDLADLIRASTNHPSTDHMPEPVSDRMRLDYILHFASPASPKDYARHPIETLKCGSFGTYNALNLAILTDSVFLLASTSEVYGDPDVSPQPETYWGKVNPLGLRSVYDEAKRFAEAMTIAFHRKYNLRVRIIRIFNTYGERMRVDDGRALPNFLSQALQGEPLTVYGDGGQTRSFCYVSDLVEGIHRMLLSNETGPVNLGNPEEVSVLEMAKEVIRLTGSKSKMRFEALPGDDPQRRKPDISKAISVLGWRPRVSRRNGIRRVIPYFKAMLEPASARSAGGQVCDFHG
ncbi:MAG: SDR family oxidoreductase [Candidatus Eisenbacteria bacterium]|uniref:SDR family oxidoreductase n=1 Tax=Eiseniibacteriota bacterium TaxID=2212470 RepID=A0A538TBD5_UNCEI|nr:MAG: SDR family oxidoreductase [Candidatus Eisenbacteria bacterium]